jgi:tetratricopeptide (TPR) repeat protein
MHKKNIISYLNIILFAVILVSVFSLVSFPQNISREVKDGLELCYRFKWNQAEEIFGNMIKENPDDANGYHFLSGVYLWYYLGSREKNDFSTFVKYSDQAIEKAKSALDEKPQSAFLNYILGSNYMYRAIAFTREENYLDAVWASKKSESYLNETLEIDPRFTDAYLGLGLYNFAVGQIPSAFQWALSLAGIHGDKQTGINYIKKAATSGNLAKVEAQYYLSQILTEVLFENEAALYYLKNLVRRYPENLLFNYSYAVLEMKERNLRDAHKILMKIVYLDNLRFSQIISFSNFLMGDILFRRNQFDSAKVYYQSFLSSTPTTDYTGIANYRLALCYELTNDRKTAEKYFSSTGSGNMDLEDDQFAKRKGEIYSKRSLSVNEMNTIEAVNLLEAGKYQAGYDSLFNLLPNIKTEWLRGEVLLNLSEAAFMLGKFDESLDAALSAIKINSAEEKWIAPFAAYFAARVYQKKKDEKNFDAMIEQIEDYSEYDYQNKLKNLVFSLSFRN